MDLINNIKRNWKNLDNHTRYAFYIILIASLIRFALASINHVTGDPCWYVNAVRFIAENNNFPLFEPIGRTPFWPPPLLEITGAIFYKFFALISLSLAEFSLKLISPVFGTLTLFYVFLIAKKLFNTRTAFYATLFMSFIPNHIYQSSMFFPDVMVGFLIITGIYYALKDKMLLSGILIGLSFLTKYNALFAFPIPIFIIIFNNYKQKIITIIKKLSLFSITSFAIGSFWFIRNYILLGNPIFPLFNSLFIKDIGYGWGGKMHLLNIINPSSYIKLYLSFFGVPDGYYQNLFFLNIPFLKIFLAIWVLGTLLFIFPVLIGLFNMNFKHKSSLILAAWLTPYLLFSFLTLTSMQDAQAFLSRYIIPIFPIVSILWAVGFIKTFAARNKRIKSIIVIILIAAITGFITVEFVKALVVKNTWNSYSSDFEWVKENTPKDSIFLVPVGSCYSYNFNRPSYPFFEPAFQKDSIKSLGQYNISYVLASQSAFYGFTPGTAAIYPEEFTDYIQDTFKLVYDSKQTRTKIYKIYN